MTTEDSQQTLRITVEEVERVQSRQLPRRVLRPRITTSNNAQQAPSVQQAASVQRAASVQQAPAAMVSSEKEKFFLHAWFYLGVAGLLASLIAWAVAEPGYQDGLSKSWGNVWLIPGVVSLICVALSVSESLIERSRPKVLRRAGLSLVLGLLFGFVVDWLASSIYQIGVQFCGTHAGDALYPGVWVVRGIAWAVIGAAGGIAYGIVGESARKAGYGAMGGALGAAIGGLIFDPVSLLAHGGAPSRAIGFGLLGMSTGLAVGLVENALKERWLYVTAGPLAGKQFILYKAETIIGSHQNCDIYLFKDPEIEPDHAVLEVRASCLYLRANGTVLVDGEQVVSEQLLENGADVAIGRYHFRYQEKEQ